MSSEQDQSKPVEEAKPAKKDEQPRRFLSVLVWIAVFLLLAGVVLVQWFTPQLDIAPGVDGALANIISLILAFFASMTVVSWFVFSGLFSVALRYSLVGVAVVGVVALGAMLRVDQVSGNMLPVLSFRWSARPDELLDKPKTDDEPVDLLTTTDIDSPQFLGPNRDSIVPNVKLNRDWAKHPPKLVWRQPIGAGLCSFSAVNGFAVTMEQRGEDEMVTCYEIETGKPRWWHAVKARHHTTLGDTGPRSTPTIHQGRVYALGATGKFQCLDGATGKPLWSHDLLTEYGVKEGEDYKAIGWGRANSALIVNDWVVIPAGGPLGGPYVSLVAYQKDTGEKVWEAGDTQVSYSSPSLATIGGIRQVVSVNEDNVTGHFAGRASDDSQHAGDILWSFDWPGQSNTGASVSQAHVLSGEQVFISKGYGQGAAVFQLEKNNERNFTATELWHKPSVMKTKFANVVIRDGFVYGLSDGILECIDIKTGRRKWKPRAAQYGHGQVLLVGDLLLVQAESGAVVLVEPSPKRHVELARFQAIRGKTWNNMCLYGRYLLVRNAKEAACYELAVLDP